MPSYSQYKRQIAVLDADDTEIESWITVRGNHIPIKKGQSKEEAVKSFLKNKGGSSSKTERKLSNGGSTLGLTQKEHNKIERHNEKVGKIAAQYKAEGKKASEFIQKLEKKDPAAVKKFVESVEKSWGKNSKEAQKAREKYGIKEESSKKWSNWGKKGSVKEVIKPDIEKRGSVSIVSKGSGEGKYKIGETVKQGKILAIQKANLSDTPYYQIEKPDGKKEWLIEEEIKKPESKYSPEFEVVRKNALANGNVYGGKYTQKSKAEAYKEYKNDTSSKENMKKANEFVNSDYEKSKKHEEIEKAWQKTLASLEPKTIEEADLWLADALASTEGFTSANFSKEDRNMFEKLKKKFGNEWLESHGQKKSSKKWSSSWKPTAKQKQEAGFRLLEIGYNDVNFGKDPVKNKQSVLKAIKESKTENADYLTNIVKNMPDNSFSDVEKFRTGVKNAKKEGK